MSVGDYIAKNVISLYEIDMILEIVTFFTILFTFKHLINITKVTSL